MLPLFAIGTCIDYSKKNLASIRPELIRRERVVTASDLSCKLDCSTYPYCGDALADEGISHSDFHEISETKENTAISEIYLRLPEWRIVLVANGVAAQPPTNLGSGHTKKPARFRCRVKSHPDKVAHA